eukprot:gene24642-10265_t
MSLQSLSSESNVVGAVSRGKSIDVPTSAVSTRKSPSMPTFIQPYSVRRSSGGTDYSSDGIKARDWLFEMDAVSSPRWGNLDKQPGPLTVGTVPTAEGPTLEVSMTWPICIPVDVGQVNLSIAVVDRTLQSAADAGSSSRGANLCVVSAMSGESLAQAPVVAGRVSVLLPSSMLLRQVLQAPASGGLKQLATARQSGKSGEEPVGGLALLSAFCSSGDCNDVSGPSCSLLCAPKVVSVEIEKLFCHIAHHLAGLKESGPHDSLRDMYNFRQHVGDGCEPVLTSLQPGDDLSSPYPTRGPPSACVGSGAGELSSHPSRPSTKSSKDSPHAVQHDEMTNDKPKPCDGSGHYESATRALRKSLLQSGLRRPRNPARSDSGPWGHATLRGPPPRPVSPSTQDSRAEEVEVQFLLNTNVPPWESEDEAIRDACSAAWKKYFQPFMHDLGYLLTCIPRECKPGEWDKHIFMDTLARTSNFLHFHGMWHMLFALLSHAERESILPHFRGVPTVCSHLRAEGLRLMLEHSACGDLSFKCVVKPRKPWVLNSKPSLSAPPGCVHASKPGMPCCASPLTYSSHLHPSSFRLSVCEKLAVAFRSTPNSVSPEFSGSSERVPTTLNHPQPPSTASIASTALNCPHRTSDGTQCSSQPASSSVFSFQPLSQRTSRRSSQRSSGGCGGGEGAFPKLGQEGVSTGMGAGEDEGVQKRVAAPFKRAALLVDHLPLGDSLALDEVALGERENVKTLEPTPVESAHWKIPSTNFWTRTTSPPPVQEIEAAAPLSVLKSVAAAPLSVRKSMDSPPHRSLMNSTDSSGMASTSSDGWGGPWESAGVTSVISTLEYEVYSGMACASTSVLQRAVDSLNKSSAGRGDDLISPGEPESSVKCDFFCLLCLSVLIAALCIFQNSNSHNE